ncbi:MAG: cardiolipin synthase ClsB [Myxococcaceae bacterium]|nr:cardiolipin synthase ClsB [Myxococcaceae bacterium]
MRGDVDLSAFEQSLREEAQRRSPASGGGTSALPAELSAAAERYVGVDPSRMVPGNRFKLLRDGVEAFPEMLDAIRAARRKIRLEVYMFIDDAVGALFARALAEAAARGVQVKVLYDWLGSLPTRRAFFRRLRAEGVDVRAFKPLNFARGIGALIRRDHRKILVVDGEVAFVGGINLAAQWAPRGRGQGGGWRDDVMKIEGPAALTLERLFCASWRMEAHKRLYRYRRRSARRRLLQPGDANAVILSSRRAIHRAYLRAIEHARRSVMIANAYFLPDGRLMRALRQAAQRGVSVQLILAGKSDHPWVKWATRALYDRMLGWGVQIYEWYDGVLHSKTAVVDGTWGTVGSFNLEPMSRRFNYEANLVFTDPRWGAALQRSFLEDSRLCRRITRDVWTKRPWWHRVIERLFFVLSRVVL